VDDRDKPRPQPPRLTEREVRLLQQIRQLREMLRLVAGDTPYEEAVEGVLAGEPADPCGVSA
jgi:hypothetical protein